MDAPPEAAELVIKKETVAVELCTVRGDVRRGSVFLRPTDGADRGERLLDVLSQRWFVPLKTRAPPYLPCVDQAAVPIVPALPVPEASATAVPDPSLKE